MSHNTGFSRHQSYNNRFHTPSSGGDSTSPPTATAASVPHPATALEDVDVFGHSTAFAKLSRQDSEHPSTRQEELGRSSEIQHGVPGLPDTPDAENRAADPQAPEHVPLPLAPGKPRRLSRQTSAGARRQNFAASRSVSGGNGHSTSLDSNRDDVFVELDMDAAPRIHQPAAAGYDSSLFPSGKRGEVLSTSSSVSAVPNPYNRLNHRLHDAVWFCNCLYFVFFCCLPAIHMMEQSDVHFKLDDQKKARRLGRASTVLFFVGALLTLLFLALVFFVGIYFSTH